MAESAEIVWVKRVLGLNAVAARPEGRGIGATRRAAPARGYDTPPETGEMQRFASAYGTPEPTAADPLYAKLPEGGDMPRPATAYGTPEQSDADAYAAPPEAGGMPRPATAYSGAEGVETEAPVRQKAKTFAPVDTTPTPTGMKAKRVADGYEGEHNQAAWRNWGVAKDNTQITTKLYTDEERAANTLQLDEGGRNRKGDGSSVASKEVGYAMDASGKVVTFKENKAEIITTDADGNATRRDAGGLDDIKDTVRADPGARAELTHHSTVLGGDEVTDEDGKPVLDGEGRPMMRSRAAASAGVLKFDFLGRIVKINNNSGHYKPQVDYLLQAVEQLTKQGAFFEDDITDADGNILSGDDKRLRLYDAVKDKLKHAQTLGDRAATLTEALAAAEDARDQADIADDLGQLSAEIDQLNTDVAQAQKVLRKLGVAPSQTLREDAKVEFLDIKPGMTPFQIKTASTEKMRVKKFLKSGGGNLEALDQKKDVLDEIRSAGKRTRKALNVEAQARADEIGGSGPAPDDDAVEAALAALTGGGAQGGQGQGGEPGAAPPAEDAPPPARDAAHAAPQKPAAAYADLADLNPEAAPQDSGRFAGAYSAPDQPRPK
jgi:hypothetical protein